MTRLSLAQFVQQRRRQSLDLRGIDVAALRHSQLLLVAAVGAAVGAAVDGVADARFGLLVVAVAAEAAAAAADRLLRFVLNTVLAAATDAAGANGDASCGSGCAAAGRASNGDLLGRNGNGGRGRCQCAGPI